MRGRFVLTLSLASLYLLATLALLATSGWLLATASLRPGIGSLHVAIAGVRLFGLIRPLLKFVERYLAHDTTLHLMGHLRRELFRKLVAAPDLHLDARREAELTTLMMADVDVVEHVPLRLLFPVTTAGLASIVVVLWGLLLHPHLGLAILSTFLAVTLLSLFALRLISGSAGQRIPKRRSHLNALFLEIFENRFQLAQGGAFVRYLERLEETTRLYETDHKRLQRSEGRLRSFQMALPWLTIVPLLPLVYRCSQEGAFSGAIAVALVLTLLSATEQLASALAGLHHLPQIRASSARLFGRSIVRQRSATPPQRKAEPTGTEVRARCVELSYQPSLPPALTALSFQIDKPRRVMIAGPSGSGKSTLGGLIAGSLEPSQGEFSLLGIPADATTKRARFELCSSVTPRSHLFEMTIGENLRLAAPNATEAELQSALIDTGLNRLHDSIDTTLNLPLEESASNLSAGERQRLLLAQALLRNRPVTLLDESFSHIDFASRAPLLSHCSRQMASLFYTSHEVDLFPIADTVLYLEGGRLTESGPFATLMAKRSAFFHFVQSESESVH
jgi:ABC-type transport system involved in cytochrome bd biosynthesis fused ATPase/permease subunit